MKKDGYLDIVHTFSYQHIVDQVYQNTKYFNILFLHQSIYPYIFLFGCSLIENQSMQKGPYRLYEENIPYLRINQTHEVSFQLINYAKRFPCNYFCTVIFPVFGCTILCTATRIYITSKNIIYLRAQLFLMKRLYPDRLSLKNKYVCDQVAQS